VSPDKKPNKFFFQQKINTQSGMTSTVEIVPASDEKKKHLFVA